MAEGKYNAKLGDLRFRLNPDKVSYPYQIDYSIIDTIGGQVIQVLGSTVGDLTIEASFGEDRQNGVRSWQLAEEFHSRIKSMIDKQSLFQQGKTHTPVRFIFKDGVHDWDFMVLIKSIQDVDGGSIQHRTGKFAYRYVLTLFLVQESSLSLKNITTDKFIARISNGLGWKLSAFNGDQDLNKAIEFIQQNSTDGTYAGYVARLLGDTGGTSKSSNPTSTANPDVQVSGNVESWLAQAKTVLLANGYTEEQFDEAGLKIIIQGESGGDPKAQNNSDSNAAAGHPSKGLMQTIDSTFNANALPNYTNIWNPVDNIIAGFRYAIGRYGSIANVPGVKAVRNGGKYVGY